MGAHLNVLQPQILLSRGEDWMRHLWEWKLKAILIIYPLIDSLTFFLPQSLQSIFREGDLFNFPLIHSKIDSIWGFEGSWKKKDEHTLPERQSKFNR